MAHAPTYRDLLRRSAAALAAGAVMVAICYFWVDRPVAFFVHDRGLSRYRELAWPTYPPPVLETWAPLVLAVLAARRAWGPWGNAERALFAAALALIVAEECKETLAFVFGRYWPDTWVDDNPSLLRDGAYGFHPFRRGAAYGSFPSGHTARTAAVAAVVWVGYPRWRWAAAAAVAIVAVALIGMNYHFVGDVIAGGFTGAVVGAYAAHLAGVAAPAAPEKSVEGLSRFRA